MEENEHGKADWRIPVTPTEN